MSVLEQHISLYKSVQWLRKAEEVAIGPFLQSQQTSQEQLYTTQAWANKLILCLSVVINSGMTTLGNKSYDQNTIGNIRKPDLIFCAGNSNSKGYVSPSCHGPRWTQNQHGYKDRLSPKDTDPETLKLPLLCSLQFLYHYYPPCAMPSWLRLNHIIHSQWKDSRLI